MGLEEMVEKFESLIMLDIDSPNLVRKQRKLIELLKKKIRKEKLLKIKSKI